MGDIPATNVSFSSLRTAYNAIYETDIPATNISLSKLRGKKYEPSLTLDSN